MKILLCSDLGGIKPQIPRSAINECQFVLLAGDITADAKDVETAQPIFEELGNLFAQPLPVYYIPGNHDFAFIIEAEKYAWIPKNFISMHNRVIKLNPPSLSHPIVIIGFGGAKIGLFNSFAFSEEEIYTSLSCLFDSTIEERKNALTILLSHDSPANTTLDKIKGDIHIGSQAVRDIIKKYQPDLCVSGHIHEAAGKEKVGTTFAINAGEGKFDHYAIIEINELKEDHENVKIIGNLFPSVN